MTWGGGGLIRGLPWGRSMYATPEGREGGLRAPVKSASIFRPSWCRVPVNHVGSKVRFAMMVAQSCTSVSAGGTQDPGLVPHNTLHQGWPSPGHTQAQRHALADGGQLWQVDAEWPCPEPIRPQWLHTFQQNPVAYCGKAQLHVAVPPQNTITDCCL